MIDQNTVLADLGRAHALLVHAAYVVAAADMADAALMSLEVQLAVGRLEECGAVPDSDGLSEDLRGRSASQLVRTAIEVLDGTADDLRPIRLGVVRAELTGLLLCLSGDWV